MALAQGEAQLQPPHGRAADGGRGYAPGRADRAGEGRSAEAAADVADGGEQLGAQAALGGTEGAQPGRRAGAEAGARDAEGDRQQELRGRVPDAAERQLTEPVRQQQQRTAPEQRGGARRPAGDRTCRGGAGPAAAPGPPPGR